MIKKNILLIIILIIVLFCSNISAQDSITKKGFITFNTGCHLPTGADFNKIYGNFLFINGLSIGLPFRNTDVYFYGKLMYLKKTGIPVIYHFNSINGVSNNYTTQEGSIKIDQFNFSLGIQYNKRLKNNLIFLVNGGLFFVKSTESSADPVQYHIKSGGLSGLFLGFGLEKKLSFIPFSVVGEIQYNSSLAFLKTYNLIILR